MFTPYLVMAARTAIALLFALSAGSKVVGFKRFEKSVRNFDILPARWIRLAALGFLAGEGAVVVLVCVGGPLLLPGFALAILLLAVFAVALEVVVRRRLEVDCGCFGAWSEMVSRYDVVRNALLVLVAACGVGALASNGNRSGHLPAREIALLTAMSAVLILLVTNLKPVLRALERPLE